MQDFRLKRFELVVDDARAMLTRPKFFSLNDYKREIANLDDWLEYNRNITCSCEVVEVENVKHELENHLKNMETCLS